MKWIFGFVISILWSGCSLQGWSKIECPDFKKQSRDEFSVSFHQKFWILKRTFHRHGGRLNTKKKTTIPPEKKMENMDLLQSGIPFSKVMMRVSNPIKSEREWISTVPKKINSKRINEVKEVINSVRCRAVFPVAGMPIKNSNPEKRNLQFPVVLGFLALGLSGLSWLLLLGGPGFAITLGLGGALGGLISILVGLYGLNKEWERAARWAIILGLLAIILNPISFFIATYGA